MSGKFKIRRMVEAARFPNVIEYTYFNESNRPAGRWHKEFFKNSNPIILELACGKGEYTNHLAKNNPDRNYIGVDVKGPRIWRGAKTALENDLGNVRFLRIFIDHLQDYFGKDEVDEIWITFPDPFKVKKSKWKKRLTSAKFLEIYRNVLKPGGLIHLKTDSETLFNYTLDVIREQQCSIVRRVDDVYRQAKDDELLSVKTHYEKIHLKKGKTIRYVVFRLV